MIQTAPEFIFFDLFCGAGGVSSGLLKAVYKGVRLVKVAGCINHDPFAILSHCFNHKNIKHFTEDVRTFDVGKFRTLARMYRMLYPNAKICIWASLECTNFSKAKGGKSRDADSRTLSTALYRYIHAIKPDHIFIENVIEFIQGCELVPKEVWELNGVRQKASYPLDHTFRNDQLDWYYQKKVDAGEIGYCLIDTDKLKKEQTYYPVWFPNPNKIGEDYETWVDTIKGFGYDYAWKEMNAADYGEHTSRKRYFGLFSKPDLPILFPKPTHDKNGKDGLPKWLPVKEVLELDVLGEDILPEVRIAKGKKPLSPKTCERVLEGLIKWVANGDRDFLLKYNSCASSTKLNKGVSIDNPAPTIATSFHPQLVQTELLPGLVATYNGKGHNTSTMNRPSPTVPAADVMHMYQFEYFMYNAYSSGGDNSSVDAPTGSVLPRPKQHLVQAEVFITSPHFNNSSSSVDTPFPVITANRKHHYLIMPQWGVKCNHSIDKPSPTLLATMDKTPPYLVEVEKGVYAIRVNDDDTEVIKKIKFFMAYHGIKTIRMRMLLETELLQIQGFDKDYKLLGTAADRKKFIGNAVPVKVSQQWLTQFGKVYLDKKIDSVVMQVLKRA